MTNCGPKNRIKGWLWSLTALSTRGPKGLNYRALFTLSPKPSTLHPTPNSSFRNSQFQNPNSKTLNSKASGPPNHSPPTHACNHPPSHQLTKKTFTHTHTHTHTHPPTPTPKQLVCEAAEAPTSGLRHSSKRASRLAEPYAQKVPADNQ